MFLNFLANSFEDENLIKFKKEQIMVIINEFDIPCLIVTHNNENESLLSKSKIISL